MISDSNQEGTNDRNIAAYRYTLPPIGKRAVDSIRSDLLTSLPSTIGP